jgi:hypothetical protein
MANKDAAFGLKAIGKVGQNRDNQGLSEYQIAASSAAIYQNDPVEMATTGFITVAAATDVLLGALNGVFYTDASTSKPTWANHLAASNTATDIVGFVADDPYERFEVQSAGTPARTDIGACADIVYAAGSSPNYVSKVEINGTTGTASAQLKILGVSTDPDNNELGSANANLIVTINEHFIKQTAGI